MALYGFIELVKNLRPRQWDRCHAGARGLLPNLTWRSCHRVQRPWFKRRVYISSSTQCVFGLLAKTYMPRCLDVRSFCSVTPRTLELKTTRARARPFAQVLEHSAFAAESFVQTEETIKKQPYECYRRAIASSASSASVKECNDGASVLPVQLPRVVGTSCVGISPSCRNLNLAVVMQL